MIVVIRIIFLSVVLIISLLIIKKSKVINKRRGYIFSIGIVCLLFGLAGLFSVENVFVTFSSPESAFRYTNSGEILFVLEGEESARVVGENDCEFFTKSNTGWKLGSIDDFELFASGSSSNLVVYRVERYMDSEDYYIQISDVYGCASNVADNLNSEFYREENTCDVGDGTYYTYYAYVYDLDDDYTLIVNDEVFPLIDDQN